MPAVRYIVTDIAASVAFYRDVLGFAVKMDAAPRFAALERDGLTLFLNVPGAGSADAIEVPLPRPRAPTPFARLGNWLAFLTAGVLLLIAVAIRRFAR